MPNFDALLEYHEQYEFVAYAVQDTKSHSYSLPSFWRDATDAVRNFESAIFAQHAVKTGIYFSHPNDFCLCAVGGYNSSDGFLTSFEPIVVSSGYFVCLELGLEHPTVKEE